MPWVEVERIGYGIYFRTLSINGRPIWAEKDSFSLIVGTWECEAEEWNTVRSASINILYLV